MTLRRSFIQLLLILPFAAWGRGGSVIGNGAGLAENNFQYAYQSLPRFIENCLKSALCQVNSVERSLLAKISSAAQINLRRDDRLIFISEKEQPDFFTTGVSEENRIAKTELQIDTPIYINLDLLYTQSGSINLDIPTMQSILVHELGHQVGVTSHTKLDILGSKIKKFILENWQVVTLPLSQDMGGVATASIVNHNNPYKNSDVIIQWQQKSLALGRTVMKDVTCTSAEGNFTGIQIYNAHFGINPQTKNLQFYAWADLYCYNTSEKIVRLVRKNFGYEINADLAFHFLGSYNVPN